MAARQREPDAPTPTHQDVDVAGVRTHYLEAGVGDPLVLIHGGGPAQGGELTWERNVAALARRFRVIVPDEVGMGRSGHPAPGGDPTILGRLEHIHAFLRTLGLERVHLVGHSQGGFIATVIALRDPARVRRLVIVSSGTTAPLGNMTEDGQFAPALNGVLTFSQDPSYASFRRIMADWTYHPDQIEDAHLRPFFDRFEANGTLPVYVAGTERALAGRPDAYADLHHTFIAPHIADLAMPTLLLWGRDDDFAPLPRGLQLLAMMPRAEMHLFPASKHLVMWDQARAFEREVLAFCAQ